jgi:hypothetical protein
VPENGNVQVVVRRRRTRRHRRSRLIRRWLAVGLIAVFIAGVSTLALQYLSPSLFHARQSAPPTLKLSENRSRATELNQVLSHVQPPRPVYPYSVVPGGIEDAKELKWVAEHDPIVAAHYAGFDYNRARVVRLALAQTVYLSYRIGNHIYWTRRRVTLHKGETLITDGRMTARTRCANRVEQAPQEQAASPVEPPVEKFDEPLRAGEGHGDASSSRCVRVGVAEPARRTRPRRRRADGLIRSVCRRRLGSLLLSTVAARRLLTCQEEG